LDQYSIERDKTTACQDADHKHNKIGQGSFKKIINTSIKINHQKAIKQRLFPKCQLTAEKSAFSLLLGFWFFSTFRFSIGGLILGF